MKGNKILLLASLESFVFIILGKITDQRIFFHSALKTKLKHAIIVALHLSFKNI